MKFNIQKSKKMMKIVIAAHSNLLIVKIDKMINKK